MLFLRGLIKEDGFPVKSLSWTLRKSPLGGGPFKEIINVNELRCEALIFFDWEPEKLKTLVTHYPHLAFLGCSAVTSKVKA